MRIVILKLLLAFLLTIFQSFVLIVLGLSSSFGALPSDIALIPFIVLAFPAYLSFVLMELFSRLVGESGLLIIIGFLLAFVINYKISGALSKVKWSFQAKNR